MDGVVLTALDGQQKVTVEHVHSGGQAIVGAVTTGGGEASKAEERSHEQPLAHASEPAMRCPEPARDAVPVVGDEGAGSLQVSRRR
jgi:hypothetical protein